MADVKTPAKASKPVRLKRRNKWTRDDTELTLLALPTSIWFFMFCYLPMFGIIIAFKEYKVDGVIDVNLKFCTLYDVEDYTVEKALKEKTEEGNAIVGEDVRMIDSKDCIVHAPGLSKVVVQGLDGYIISQHGDRLLVCRKDHEQKITDYIK